MFRKISAIALGVIGLIVSADLLRRMFPARSPKRNAAFAENQPHDSHTDIRDAGPDAMRDPAVREWTETDEDGDESFPASDPPGGY